MIKLNGIEFLDPGDFKQIKIYYNYLGEKETKIRIFAKDAIFNTLSVFTDLYVSPGINYWTVFSADSVYPSNTLYRIGVNLVFYRWDEDTSAWICFQEERISEPIPKSFKRGLKNPQSPVFWIIGDSHISFLEGREKLSKYDLKYTCQYELSLNRFLRSNWLSFLDTLCLEDGDILSFCLGDIDLRVSIIKKANLKSQNEEEILNSILSKYVSFLQDIKEKYRNCQIVVFSPVPPLRDGIIEDDYLISGTEEKRLSLYSKFNSFMRSKSLEVGFLYFECFENYLDEEGFINSNFLKEGDHHVKDEVPFVNSLLDRLSLTNLSYI